MTKSKLISQTKYKGFFINVYETDDKDYCFVRCTKQDGWDLQDDSGYQELCETIAEAQEEGKIIIDEFINQ